MLSCTEQPSGKLFESISPDVSGVGFSNDLIDTDEENIVDYLYYYNGGGVAIEDVNNDFLPDLFFTSNQGANQLYLNQGNLKFENITASAFPSHEDDWSTGVTMADVNNDGWIDIYTSAAGSGGNRLWINNQDSSFSDQSATTNLDLQVMGTQAAFFDYDQDGDLDMYMLCHSLKDPTVFRDTSIRRQVDTLFGDRLMKNLLVESGKLTFEDVSSSSGIYSSSVGFGLGINVSDVNNDSWPDIYIGNDFHEYDYLYINNQDGTFTESSADWLPHASTFSMGNDIADINNDGLVDIMTLDMKPEDRTVFQNSTGVDAYGVFRFKQGFGYGPQYSQNCLLMNQGGRYTDVANTSGISATDWSWSVLMEDYDMDGWKDIFVSNGIGRRPNDQDYLNFLSNDAVGVGKEELINTMPEGIWSNYFYQNNGDATFIDASASWSDMTQDLSTGAATADLDLDGDLDIVVNRINDKALILENKSVTSNYLIIDVNPELRNEFLGARITVDIDGMILHDNISANRGFQSSSEPIAHFGLGDHSGDVDVTVYWPGGMKQVLEDVSISERIYLSKKEGVIESNNNLIAKTRSLDITHQENNFTDLNRQKLMPFSLASSGPGMAIGDVNGDGIDDLFIGNSTDNEDVIYLGNGTYWEFNQSLKNLNETVDGVFFDVDGDTDLDLMTISGGNEVLFELKRSIALYLNNGQGVFEKSTIQLPFSNSNHSCIRPSDIDGDGDIDVFIGKQHIKSQYGLIDKSIILINNGRGEFPKSDILVMDLGMVNDAKWADINKDGKDDLVVASEWRELQILFNNGGSFDHKIIPNSSGLWRSIDVDDIDNDGHLDIVAGNLGTNTPLHASKEHPLTMYVNDFMQSGATQPIICQYEDGKLYTYENRDNLSGEIPWIKKKYADYKSFSTATAKDIFELALDNIPTFEVDHLSSKVFKGIGDGGFSQVDLPIEAQYSTIASILIKDVNNDAIKDIITGGNLYEMTPSLGRLDGSLMNCFIAKSDGTFVNDPTILPKLGGQVRSIIPIDDDGLLVGLNNDSLRIISLK